MVAASSIAHGYRTERWRNAQKAHATHMYPAVPRYALAVVATLLALLSCPNRCRGRKYEKDAGEVPLEVLKCMP